LNTLTYSVYTFANIIKQFNFKSFNMKNLFRILKPTLVAFLLVFAVSCDNDDDNNKPVINPVMDIVALASANEDLTSLVAAIQKAELATTLQGDGPFTVFAPTNTAFASFLSDNGFANLEAVPTDVLTQVLLNHVVSGNVRSGDLTTGLNVSSLATGAGGLNLSLSINITDGVKINGATVSTANVDASNGTVHIVDAVIPMPTPVTFVTTNPSLSILAEALTTATPDNDFATILSGDGPFTVFAPTNDAFVELLGRLDGFDSLDDFSTTDLQAVLATILQYHVVSGAAVAAGALTDAQVITTLQGEDIIANIDGDAVSFSDGDIVPPANVIIPNVVATNAIVHAIDKIMLPASVVAALEGTLLSPITDIAIATPALSNLVAALIAAEGELPNVLRGDGPFTVFAPTDTAFAAFLEANDFATLADVPVPVLTQVLLNHVVSGANFSTDLTTGYVSTLSTSGPADTALNMFINTSDGVVLNGGVANSGASVVLELADIKATNGVVHVVNGVIGLPNIVNHAIANPALTSLVGALTTGSDTDFVSVLSDPEATFTVFAPVNSAFEAFENANDNLIDDILLNHVISGAAATAASLVTGYDNVTMATFDEGEFLNLYVNIDDGVRLNGVSTVAAADIVATNGIIHAVDAVIDIPTVVTFAVADPTFLPLVAALTAGTPATDFVDTLTGAGPFTVFAPTDTAFQALLDSNEAWTMVTDIDESLLTSVLLHHVVSGNVRSGDLTPDGDTVDSTLEGDDITITLPGTEDNIADVTDGSGAMDIGIIAVDVQAGNGVIHVLNKVMIPNLD